MPSTGTPQAKIAGSQRGASALERLAGPPDRITPAARLERMSSAEVVNGTISEYTDNSRRRRAMSCVYWEPKSRTRIA